MTTKTGAVASPLPEARRIHDEKVYLAEDRSREPKESFKALRAILAKARPGDAPIEYMDIGSATGELLVYLHQEFPSWSLSGLDVSESMNAVARKNVPTATILQGSVEDPSFFAEPKYDVITCSGVLSIFDRLEEPIANLVSALKPGGDLVIFGMMNEFPMDVLVRCRTADKPDQPWQIGYNAFSREYYERCLERTGRKLSWEWTKFKLPVPLPRRDDVLRNWTIKTEHDPHQQIRGTGQLSTQFFLHVKADK